MEWIKKWQVDSDSSSSIYVVSVTANGEYGCSCPRWKFKREDCKHIQQVQFGHGREIDLDDPKSAGKLAPKRRRKKAVKEVDEDKFITADEATGLDALRKMNGPKPETEFDRICANARWRS